MKKRTKNKGLRTASALVAFVLVIVFAVGNVFGSVFSTGPSYSLVVKHKETNQFVGECFFAAERPSTESVTVINAAEVVPGNKPAVTARCNSPGDVVTM